jgi:spore coat protein A
MLANGSVYPAVEVEARRYRLRVLNACNARFLNLQLYVADYSNGNADGIILDSNTLAATNQKGPDFLVLGNEGGLLPYPVLVPSNIPLNIITNPDGTNNPASEWRGSLVTSPAERWDMLVDFSGFEGKSVILYNDSPAPFPGGDLRNDYFLGAPPETPGQPGSGQPTVTQPGMGPDSRQIMRFDVVAAKGADQPLKISPDTDLTAGNDPLPVPLGDTALPAGVPVRRLILDEVTDGYGRLIQKMGTDASAVVSQGGLAFMDPPTEVVTAGTSEVWQFVNLTADTHPIHFHLVNVQIISRQPFDTTVNYTGGEPPLTGNPRPPDGYESGWKDTVRMNPGEVTNVFISFSLPTVPFHVPNSPRTGGHEYVYHCHILEHEEHDMMRPMVIKERPAPSVPVTG